MRTSFMYWWESKHSLSVTSENIYRIFFKIGGSLHNLFFLISLTHLDTMNGVFLSIIFYICFIFYSQCPIILIPNKLSLAKDRLKNKFWLQGGLKNIDGSWQDTWRIGSSSTSKIMLVVAKGHILKVLSRLEMIQLIKHKLWAWRTLRDPEWRH